MLTDYDSRRAGGERADLASRLAQARYELYGEHGGPALADVLGLPYGTWTNYERGVTIPGEVLLRFIEATGVEPLWLLRGRRPAYRSCLASEHDGGELTGE